MRFDREAGKQFAREVFGEKFLEQHVSPAENAPDGTWGKEIMEMGLRLPFGEVWSRPGLDRRSRSLLTLGILLQRGAPGEFKLHVQAALANGITAQEIEEILLHGAVYAGVPAMAQVIPNTIEALREAGKI